MLPLSTAGKSVTKAKNVANEELLNEENNETLNSLNAKRSRLLTANYTAITTDNQNPSMLADITKQCTTSSASPHTHGCLTDTSFFIGRS